MLADAAAAPASTTADEPIALAAMREDPPQRYLDGVRRIKDYIVEGDVFQVNLSRAWNVELRRSAAAATLYRHLRRRNPAPFAGLACWNRAAIISSSPERLVRVRGNHVDTRPIAGTRPRSEDDTADARFSRDLLGHPKERAEHIMLIDLERNDLGRICAPGSIHVDELMVLESYAHVHHIVSNVSGRLRDDVSPGEVIAAVFPGGTITGCPKVRCMEIIAELEQEGRGAYTGAMGYLNRDGDMDLNILIRTLVQHDRELILRAGAGIVADSVPDHELAETRAKARGLLLALGIEAPPR
jgi:anthranilate synthase component 1